MVYLAAAAILADVLTIAAFAGLVRSMLRQSARERDLMLNQIMHLAGRTWQPPPAPEPVPVVDDEPQEERYVVFPAADF